MSLIRTDYVSEWHISTHAQSVLAAGQKYHSPRLCFAVRSQWLLLLFVFNSLANLLVCFVQITDGGKMLHFRFSILRLFLPILVNH